MSFELSGGADEARLNPYQRRAIEVTLRMLEEVVDRVEYQLSATPIRGVLYELTNPYSAQEQTELRKRIEEIRRILRESREQWQLDVERTPIDVFIRSAMSVLWADLEDCRPAKLRRYGDVAPTITPEINETIQRLIRLTEDFGIRSP